MYSVYIVFVLGLLASHPAVGTCILGGKPIDIELIGNSSSAAFGCGRGGATNSREVRIKRGAVTFLPFLGPKGPDFLENICPEEISLVYVRGRSLPVLYLRPGKFGKSSAGIDCARIPARKILPFGKTRAEFGLRLKEMFTGIKLIRGFNFADCFEDTSKLSRGAVAARINKERITTAALTFVTVAAYSNLLCL